MSPTGSVNLGGCNLNATLGFTPVAGDSFTIIKSSTPITGTFNGLPEGGTMNIGGVSFTITYKGGASGDDVVLTPSVATTTPTGTTTSLESSANPSTLGQSVTFTAIVAPASGSSSPTGNVTLTIDGQARNAGGARRGQRRRSSDVHDVDPGNRPAHDQRRLRRECQLRGERTIEPADADSERRGCGNHGDPAHVLGRSFDVGPVHHFHGGRDHDGIRHAGGRRDIHDRRQGANSRGASLWRVASMKPL